MTLQLIVQKRPLWHVPFALAFLLHLAGITTPRWLTRAIFRVEVRGAS